MAVSGPQALTTLDAIWTKPINVEKKTESFTQTVALDIPGNQLNLDEDKETLKVEVAIEQKIVTKSSTHSHKSSQHHLALRNNPDKVTYG